MTALLRYDAACAALAAATSVDEAKDIADKAEALRVYARQAKNRELEVDAAEIRFCAERRLGELIGDLKARGEIAKGTRGQLIGPGLIGGSESAPPIKTLADLGIDKKLSARCQKLAAVPRGTYEQMLSDFRSRVADERERITVSLLKEGERAQRRAAFTERPADGCTVDDLRELIANGEKFGALSADCPWHYRTYSEAGEGRSASQHYVTARAFEEITSLPVAQLAADDAVLFLWIMDWDAELAMARAVMSAWGFVHKTTAFTWVKLNPSGEGYHMGQGHWTRSNPEVCLLATRGKPRRLAADVRQLIVTPVMEHSRKPDEVYDQIERLVAGPYLELYSRRSRPGWFHWGLEVGKFDAA